MMHFIWHCSFLNTYVILRSLSITTYYTKLNS